jgi:ferredoxin
MLDVFSLNNNAVCGSKMTCGKCKIKVVSGVLEPSTLDKRKPKDKTLLKKPIRRLCPGDW